MVPLALAAVAVTAIAHVQLVRAHLLHCRHRCDTSRPITIVAAIAAHAPPTIIRIVSIDFFSYFRVVRSMKGGGRGWKSWSRQIRKVFDYFIAMHSSELDGKDHRSFSDLSYILANRRIMDRRPHRQYSTDVSSPLLFINI